jgi:hypothetical protein
VALGKERARLTGHAGTVLAVSFAAGGTQALSAGSRADEDGRSVKRWELATGKELADPRPGTGSALGVRTERFDTLAFAPDGRRALLADGAEVRVVPLP